MAEDLVERVVDFRNRRGMDFPDEARQLRLFVLYIVLGHQIAADGGSTGIDRLAAAMLIAAVFAFPVGIVDARPAFTDPWLAAVAGTAALIGALVLHQVPSVLEAAAIGLVIIGVALHRREGG